MNDLKKNIIIAALGLITVLAVASAIYSWYEVRNRPPVVQTHFIEAPKIPAAVKIKTVKVPGPTKIVTIEKEVIVEKLKLPDPVKDDPNVQVIATAEIPPYEGKTNAIAVMDTSTGGSEILVKQAPLPFIAFEDIREIGVRAGMSLKEGTETSVFGRWDFLRIGSTHLGVYAEANSRGDARAQLELVFRF